MKRITSEIKKCTISTLLVASLLVSLTSCGSKETPEEIPVNVTETVESETETEVVEAETVESEEGTTDTEEVDTEESTEYDVAETSNTDENTLDTFTLASILEEDTSEWSGRIGENLMYYFEEYYNSGYESEKYYDVDMISSALDYDNAIITSLDKTSDNLTATLKSYPGLVSVIIRNKENNNKIDYFAEYDIHTKDLYVVLTTFKVDEETGEEEDISNDKSCVLHTVTDLTKDELNEDEEIFYREQIRYLALLATDYIDDVKYFMSTTRSDNGHNVDVVGCTFKEPYVTKVLYSIDTVENKVMGLTIKYSDDIARSYKLTLDNEDKSEEYRLTQFIDDNNLRIKGTDIKEVNSLFENNSQYIYLP